jgi:uncharacterized membrane protein YoaK (UPF0700 family)
MSNTENSQTSARKLVWKAATLTLVAGFVDAYGIIIYQTYLSFMSGNTTQTGYRIGQSDLAAAVPSGLAVIFFVVGSFAGSFLVRASWRRPHQLVFGSVAVLLALIIGLTQIGFLLVGFHIAVISFAMGVINSGVERVGAVSVSLSFVTGTLHKIGEQLALAAKHAPLRDSQGPWDTHIYRAALLARVWTGFLAGAFLSGAATPHFGARVLLFPILILLVLMTLDGGRENPTEKEFEIRRTTGR